MLEIIDSIQSLKFAKHYPEAEKLCSTILTEEYDKRDLLSFDPAKAKSIALLYNERGHLRYKQVKFNEAVEDFNKALQLDSLLSAAFYNRGTIHYRLGRFVLAVEDMKKATVLEPNNEEYLLGLKESLKRLPSG